jgi:hypothetical protein
MVFVKNSLALGANKTPVDKRLYMYNSSELSAFFEDIGYQDFGHNMVISRNSDGTALRFLNTEKKKILIAKCDGSITIIDSPGYQTWLNDADQPVVWLTSSGNKVNANYANGMSEKRPFSPSCGPDPSGKYFMKDAPEKLCYTTIYSAERPNVPLIEVNLCGEEKLFVKDKKIYLLGKRHVADNVFVSEVRIFQEKGQLLEQVDSIVVPRPNESALMFHPADFCPWNDEILYLNAHDFPARSVWYSFDMKTRQMNKVGKMSIWGGHAFYLQCDIIKKVIEMKKRK